MARIQTAHLIDLTSQWEIEITDLATGGRYHENRNKLNYLTTSRNCNFLNCPNTFKITRTSGLCNIHKKHRHSLFLRLKNPVSGVINSPLHTEIVDKLILWAGSRNFDMLPFFRDISFNLLGNIPDVSTLSGDNFHIGFTPPNLQQLLNDSLFVVDRSFPETNNSSYQLLKTTRGDIPARVLALAFYGLIVCEEANRGDRWFNRMIRKDESKTEMLGGAMPIGYFAARTFPWGIEIGKAAARFVPML